MILDLNSRILTCDDGPVRLTIGQAKIMVALARSFPRYANPHDIAAEIWPVEHRPADQKTGVRIHIAHFRRRVREAGIAQFIYAGPNGKYKVNQEVVVVEKRLIVSRGHSQRKKTGAALASRLLDLLRSVNGGPVSEEIIVSVVWRGFGPPANPADAVRSLVSVRLHKIEGVNVASRSTSETRFYRLLEAA